MPPLGEKWVKRRCQILERWFSSTISHHTSLQAVVRLKRHGQFENVRFGALSEFLICQNLTKQRLAVTLSSITTTREKQPNYSSLQWRASSSLLAVAVTILSRASSPLLASSSLLTVAEAIWWWPVEVVVPALACSSRNAAYNCHGVGIKSSIAFFL